MWNVNSVWKVENERQIQVTVKQCFQFCGYEILCRASELTCSCEHGSEPSGYIKGGKYLDYLRVY
jgi:hypothetical protein